MANLVSLGWLASLAGCYTVPETGRTAINFIGTDTEVSLGISEFNKIKRQSPISSDPVMVGRLQRVGWRISQVVGGDLPEAEWEFVLFDEPDLVNAFALPGGKVGVYSGIMEVAQTEDELATVVAHEIAHVTARHGSERMSHGVLATIAGSILEGALAGDRDRDTYLAAYGPRSYLWHNAPVFQKSRIGSRSHWVDLCRQSRLRPKGCIGILDENEPN